MHVRSDVYTKHPKRTQIEFVYVACTCGRAEQNPTRQPPLSPPALPSGALARSDLTLKQSLYGCCQRPMNAPESLQAGLGIGG